MLKGPSPFLIKGTVKNITMRCFTTHPHRTKFGYFKVIIFNTDKNTGFYSTIEVVHPNFIIKSIVYNIFYELFYIST